MTRITCELKLDMCPWYTVRSSKLEQGKKKRLRNTAKVMFIGAVIGKMKY